MAAQGLDERDGEEGHRPTHGEEAEGNEEPPGEVDAFFPNGAKKHQAGDAAAEEEAELRQHADRAGERRGQGHDQRVAVLHMRQFVRQDGHAGLGRRAVPQRQAQAQRGAGRGGKPLWPMKAFTSA